MDTEFGFAPLPEEGTEAFEVLGLTEECGVTACRGDAADPCEAAAAYSGQPRCPGHCARYAALTLRGKER